MGAFWQAWVSNVRYMRLCRDFGVPDNLEQLMQSLANSRGFLHSSSMPLRKSLSCSLINRMYPGQGDGPAPLGRRRGARGGGVLPRPLPCTNVGHPHAHIYCRARGGTHSGF
jgi:hypothetical protein